MVAVDEVSTRMTTPGRSALLRHHLQDKVHAFYAQLSANDPRSLTVPLAMELVLSTKFKIKDGGLAVNTTILESKWCEYRVQLLEQAGRVVFLRGWSPHGSR
jgi:hypothetical protein